jgi:transcriptional regulator with XRE-family HTH domain
VSDTRVIFCTHGGAGKDGFTNLGNGPLEEQWWVHANKDCMKPTQAWLMGHASDMLNYFRGGPIDGAAYDTQTLVSTAATVLPVAEYHWTPEVITSQATGASARVWAYGPTPVPTELEAPVIAPKPEPERPAAVPETGPSVTLPSQDTTSPMVWPDVPADIEAALPDGPVSEQYMSPEEDDVAGSATVTPEEAGPQLLEERTESKFSRKAVADAAGVTTAVLWRVEQGRGKAEEITAITKALKELTKSGAKGTGRGGKAKAKEDAAPETAEAPATPEVPDAGSVDPSAEGA